MVEIHDGLEWHSSLGFGFYPVPPSEVYDADYFKKYQAYTDTPMGHALTQARVDLVERHYPGSVVDIGIGAGDFVQAMSGAFGYDVNPAGIEWLKSQNAWCNPYETPVSAITCWDSLEHIESPGNLLKQVRGWVFVSIPIFESCEHVLRSKHFRKDEHFWYFTHEAFVRFMQAQDFELVEYNSMESDLGRDGIGTYAFRRGNEY
jgi:hypothetical protein